MTAIQVFDRSKTVPVPANSRHTVLSCLCAAILLLAACLPALAASPVLMISIDGLKPEYVTQADAHGLKIPVLRRFLTEGTYADGVIGVMPTVTYPSHTTLITGVWPAEHGIYDNGIFDPYRTFAGAWYWYGKQIRVPTLWEAAKTRGLTTASVSWPVSVDARGVDYLIPEYWRASVGGGKNPDDRLLMAALSRPAGLFDNLANLDPRIGPYMMGNDTSVDGDATRTRYSLAILRTKKPAFMTIHLSSLDASEHEGGPFSDEADKTLEAVDGMVGQLIAAAKANDPHAVVVIVSDHGFAPSSKAVNLAIPFIEAGLIQVDKGKVTSWLAEPWGGGAMFAIMLHDPADAKVKAQAREILDKVAADPANGVAKILTPKEIKTYGGFPDAAFVLAFKPGYIPGGNLSGPLITDAPEKGAHGYLTDFPEMHSSFFVIGYGSAAGRNLGIIDMRRIAPTVARILGASLPTAKQPPLKVGK
jgi:predicted AlkP superfamily pyrophosphatase or phosphodiesterase